MTDRLNGHSRPSEYNFGRLHSTTGGWHPPLIPPLAPTPRHRGDAPQTNGSSLTSNTTAESHRPTMTTAYTRMRHPGDTDVHDYVGTVDINMKGITGWIVGAIVVTSVCACCYAYCNKMDKKTHSKSTYQYVQTMSVLSNVGVIHNAGPSAPYPCQAERDTYTAPMSPPPYSCEVEPYPQEPPPPYTGETTPIMKFHHGTDIVDFSFTNTG